MLIETNNLTKLERNSNSTKFEIKRLIRKNQNKILNLKNKLIIMDVTEILDILSDFRNLEVEELHEQVLACANEAGKV